MTVGEKKQCLVALPHGGVDQETVPDALQSKPCLTQEQVARLAGIGINGGALLQAPRTLNFPSMRQERSGFCSPGP